VTTDNDTVHYKYISSRLTREIVEQHEAARPRWRRTASFRVGFASLGLEGLAPDYRNRYDLARRATNAVKDNTGNFNSPGPYLRGKHSGARAPLREATERSRWVRGENEDARRTQLSEGGIQTSPLKRRPRTSSAPTPCFLAVAM